MPSSKINNSLKAHHKTGRTDGAET